ncbi:MAG TPA: sugar phosphate nucleotidyltransferase [Candidatus Paceibacterota bacterium]|nr:sugar phosphate nucleotidyltransferase [Candidatus Paceibacterota bacterium]
MKCVILAAGAGTRLLPLTKEIPKPLIQVSGKPILDYIVEALPQEIDGLILVVSYLQEKVREHCGDAFKGLPVQYVVQDEPRGTGHALMQCKELLSGKFLVMLGDDIHGKEALSKMIVHDLALLTAPSEHPERFGVVTLKDDGTLGYITEKPEHPDSNLVSTGVMVLDERIFIQEMKQSETHKEYFLPDMVKTLAEEQTMHVERQPIWIPINRPEDIPQAEAEVARLHI